MEITFSQQENVYRLSATRGQKIYQKIVTEQDFTSMYVDISDLHKCFSATAIDKHTTCFYKVIESADTSAIEIDLEIRFQKSPKMKVGCEKFSFMLPVIHRDAQLEEIVRLKKECAALTEKMRVMESYQMGYYDHRYLSVGDSYIYIDRVLKSECINLNDKCQSYIWNHKRFIKYQSFFKLNQQGLYFYVHKITLEGIPKQPGEHESQEKKEKYDIDIFIYDIGKTITKFGGGALDIKPECMKILSRKYEKMTQYHAEIEMTTTYIDLNVEYRLRGKILMPPTLYGDRYYMIEHPTDPEHITHTFDLLKHLRNPPTAADRLFFNPAVGFYQTPTEFL